MNRSLRPQLSILALATALLLPATIASADPSVQGDYTQEADWSQWDAYSWEDRNSSYYGKKGATYVADEGVTMSLGDEEWYLFRSGEVFFDAFYANLKVKKIGDNVPYGDEHGGGGGGLGFYFHRNVGFELGGFFAEGNPYVDGAASSSILIRVPVDHWSIAFYGLAGPGYEWGRHDQWAVHIGGGLDVRLTNHTSTFFDARYVEPENEISSTLFRLGVRFLF